VTARSRAGGLRPLACWDGGFETCWGMDVCVLCVCFVVCFVRVVCVLLSRGVCDGLITCPEDSYRMWCV